MLSRCLPFLLDIAQQQLLALRTEHQVCDSSELAQPAKAVLCLLLTACHGLVRRERLCECTRLRLVISRRYRRGQKQLVRSAEQRSNL